jgi:hypothetical protein
MPNQQQSLDGHENSDLGSRACHLPEVSRTVIAVEQQEPIH